MYPLIAMADLPPSSFYRVRLVARVYKIEDVIEDVYLILMFNDKQVQVYESAENSNELVLKDNRRMIHMGSFDKRGKGFNKLQGILNDLLEHYPSKIN